MLKGVQGGKAGLESQGSGSRQCGLRHQHTPASHTSKSSRAPFPLLRIQQRAPGTLDLLPLATYRLHDLWQAP